MPAQNQGGHFRELADWSGTTPRQLVQTHLTKRANTARGYREDLKAFAAWLNLSRDDKGLAAAARRLIDNGRAAAKRMLIAWINEMCNRQMAANSIRRRVASLKSLIELAADPDIEIIAWNLGRLPNLPPAVRVRDCQGPDKATVDRMFIACQDRFDAKGARDKAMLALLYWHALRASEVLSIRAGDVDIGERTIRILAKRGQGRMTLRLCPLAAEAIEDWMAKRGDDDGPLFNRCQRYGRKVLSTPLTYSGMLSVVRNLGSMAGRRCWPHALRHAAVSHLAALTSDSPLWGCALSRHRDVRAWAMYQDKTVTHVSAAEILSRGQIVRRDPQPVDN